MNACGQSIPCMSCYVISLDLFSFVLVVSKTIIKFNSYLMPCKRYEKAKHPHCAKMDASFHSDLVVIDNLTSHTEH